MLQCVVVQCAADKARVSKQLVIGTKQRCIRATIQCLVLCCGVLQCVAVCGSVWQCVAVCCNVLQCVAVCCSVLQCVVVCCSVLCCSVLQTLGNWDRVMLHQIDDTESSASKIEREREREGQSVRVYV